MKSVITLLILASILNACAVTGKLKRPYEIEREATAESKKPEKPDGSF